MKGILISVALFLLVGLAAYFFETAATIFWWLYIIGVVVIQLFFVIGLIRLYRGNPDLTSALLISLGRASAERDNLSSLRFRTAMLLNSLASVITWPIEVIIFVWRASVVGLKTVMFLSTKGLAHQSLYPLESVRALVVMFLTVLLFRLGVSPTITAIGWSYVMLWLIAQIISSADLAKQLRQSAGNPYLRLVLTGIACYVTIVIAYSHMYITLHPSAQIDLIVRQTAVALVSPSDFLTTFASPTFQPLEIALTASGLIFYTSVIRLLFQHEQFKPTDADWITLSMRHSQVGNWTAALKDLRNIKDISKNSLEARALALLGKRDYDDAMKAFEQVSQLDVSAGMLNMPAEVRGAYSLGLLFPSEDVLLDYLLYWLNKGSARDSVLHCIIALYLQLSLIASTTNLKNVIGSVAGSVSENYSLTYALIALYEGEFSEFYDLWDQNEVEPFDEIIRILLLIGVTTVQLKIEPESFDEDARGELLELANSLSALGDHLKDYQILLAYDRATGVLTLASDVDVIRRPLARFTEHLKAVISNRTSDQTQRFSLYFTDYLDRSLKSQFETIKKELESVQQEM